MKRFSWIMTIGGRRAIVSVFVARRGTLHRGQFHLSSPSMISLAMKSSMSSWTTTLFLPVVIGSEMYMNVSYVVDVWTIRVRYLPGAFTR